jgi:hypothetical protein
MTTLLGLSSIVVSVVLLAYAERAAARGGKLRR